MQSAITQQSLSTGTHPTASTSLNNGTGFPLSGIYHRITDLPLKNFIRCAVYGDLTALVISGAPSVEVLQTTWADLQQQYAEALGDNDTKLALNLYKQIIKLTTSLTQIYRCIDILKDMYVKQFADALNRLLSTNFRFDVTKPDEYDHNLQSCITRSKNIELNIELKTASYEAMKATGEGAPLTEEYFQDVLITLSDYAKYDIGDNITVYQYCQRLVRLNKYIEQLNKKKQ